MTKRNSALVVGTELEGWVVDNRKAGMPVCVDEFMSDLQYEVDAFELGAVTKEPGIGSIEIVGNHGNILAAGENLSMLSSSVECFLRELGYSLRFEPVRPVLPPKLDGPESGLSRYDALWRACGREVGSYKKAAAGLGLMNVYAASQIHISKSDECLVSTSGMSPTGLLVMNVFNHYGPRIARILCEAHGINSCRNLSIWSGWASPRRFSSPRTWFSSFKEIKTYFERIPRLICQTGGGGKYGDFDVDLTHHLRWKEKNDHGAGWWLFARPRPHNGCGTIEIRILPSVQPKTFVSMMEDLSPFIEYLFDVAPKYMPTLQEFEQNPRFWRDICDFQIAGREKLPHAYSTAEWHGDVLHLRME